MAKNLAIVVGINEYQDRSLKSLNYAQRDAELMYEFLRQQAKFTEVCLFCRNLPDFQGYSTHPSRYALRKFLRERFNYPFLDPFDHFWFFFSGHGIRHQNRDYLIPEDGDPDDPEETAISLHWVTERLSRSGSRNIVLILDACRQAGRDGQKGDEKFGNDVQKGIVTIYACQPYESSWEIAPPIGQGTFTYTLLQSFQRQTAQSCLTIEQMEQYLQQKVPELNRQYGKPWQTPHIQIDSVSQSKQILLPHYAVQVNIAELRTAALEAELEEDFDLADQLWTQILMTSEADRAKALNAIRRIERKRANNLSASLSVSQSTGQRSVTSPLEPELVIPIELPVLRSVPVSEELESFDLEQVWLEAISKISFHGAQTLLQQQACLLSFDGTKAEIGIKSQPLFQMVKKQLPNIEAAFEKAYRRKIQVVLLVATCKEKQDETATHGIRSQTQTSIVNEVDLSSERFGANYYAKLQDLLKAGKWKEADQETNDRLCKVMDRQKEGWFREEDIQKFPCQDLLNIDRLWVKYSNGKFGFGVQKKIYLECGALLEGKYPGDRIWREYSDRVGWRVNESWLYYDNLTFDASAPSGHLPVLRVFDLVVGGSWGLFSRIETCKL